MGESRLVQNWNYEDMPNVKLDMRGRLSWKRDDDFSDGTMRSHYDQFFNWRLDEDDEEFVIRFSRKPEAPPRGHINVDMKIEGGLSTQPDGSVLFDGGLGNGEGNKVSKFSLSFEISHESPPDSDPQDEHPEEHEIKFFHHPEHKLVLTPENYWYDLYKGRGTCDACTELFHKKNSRWSYKCADNCDYGVHAKCAQMARTIRHPSHLKHNLKLLKLAPGCFKICDVCKGGISRGLHYNCAMCDFDLHAECPDPDAAPTGGVDDSEKGVTMMTPAQLQMQLYMTQQMAASMANAGQAMCNLIG